MLGVEFFFNLAVDLVIPRWVNVLGDIIACVWNRAIEHSILDP